MQLLLALLALLIVFYMLYVGIAYAAKSLTPRQSIEQQRSEELNEYKNKIISNRISESRPATEEELYEDGWIVRDVIKDGKECMEKQGIIIWCQPD